MNATPKLNAALAKAQKAMRAARKEKTNPHFKSKYADGAEVWAVWQEVGPDHGLSILQTPMDAPAGFLKLGMTLLHDSGEERDCGAVTMRLGQDSPQGYGSALTYASRYIMKAVGVASDDDDDGNAASAPASKPPAAKPKAPPANKPTAVAMPISESGRVPTFAAPSQPLADDPLAREVALLHGLIQTAKTKADLDGLVSRLSGLPNAERDALRPTFATRMAEVTRTAA